MLILPYTDSVMSIKYLQRTKKKKPFLIINKYINQLCIKRNYLNLVW